MEGHFWSPSEGPREAEDNWGLLQVGGIETSFSAVFILTDSVLRLRYIFKCCWESWNTVKKC